jgi:DNA-binding transcriptional MerR regulator
MVQKSQGIEDEGKKMGISIKELADALDNFKQDKEMADEKVKAKLELLTGDDNDIKKKLEDFIEDQEKSNEKQSKNLVIEVLAATKTTL